MDMHRRRRRWHNNQRQPTPTNATTATLADSVEHKTNDHNFSHHCRQTNGTDATHNKNFIKFNNETNKEQVKENAANDSDVMNDDDLLANVLSLKLRKPKHWKWELTTSKSCSNIALPRILLYDHEGQLLVDAQEDGNGESVYRQDDYEKPKRDRSKKRSYEKHDKHDKLRQEPTSQQPYQQQRSATTNLTHSIRKALENEFNGLQIQEATPSPEPTYSQTSTQSRCSRKTVDFITTDLPDYSLSRRSSSLKGVRFNVDKEDDYLTSHIPEFLPTPPSTITTPTTSSSSGPREKRKNRRSHSSGRSSAHSESILERFSYQRGRFSSPEYAEEQEIDHGPRYILRTSKAGTLVVQEDSFRKHPHRRRRRPLKNHSTESLQKSPSSSTTPTQHLSANHTPTPSEINSRKVRPIRRYYTDGNILMNKQTSLSDGDEVAAVDVERNSLLDNISSSARHLRKYAEERNRAKGE